LEIVSQHILYRSRIILSNYLAHCADSEYTYAQTYTHIYAHKAAHVHTHTPQSPTILRPRLRTPQHHFNDYYFASPLASHPHTSHRRPYTAYSLPFRLPTSHVSTRQYRCWRHAASYTPHSSQLKQAWLLTIHRMDDRRGRDQPFFSGYMTTFALV